MPISIIHSKSAFSEGGKLISAHHSRLLPSTIEALMCPQSWQFMLFEDKLLSICPSSYILVWLLYIISNFYYLVCTCCQRQFLYITTTTTTPNVGPAFAGSGEIQL